MLKNISPYSTFVRFSIYPGFSANKVVQILICFQPAQTGVVKSKFANFSVISLLSRPEKAKVRVKEGERERRRKVKEKKSDRENRK